MHEQTVPFLTSLWLHAIFSDATRATWLGAFYICCRISYYFLFSKGAALLLSTCPMYAVIWGLILPVGWHAVVDLSGQ